MATIINHLLANNDRTVTGRYFGTGNGSRLVFNLAGLDSDRALLHPVLYKQDWSGITALYGTARTNLALQSQTLNTTWMISNAANMNAVTANAYTAPDGTATADKLQPKNTNAQHFIATSPTAFTAVPYTLSAYTKYDSQRWVSLSAYDGVTLRGGSFDLLNSVVGTKSAGVTNTMTSVGDGWYRLSITFTPAAGSATVYLVLNGSDFATVQTHLAAGTELSCWWGVQLEVGTTATPYIPTTTAGPTQTATDYSTSAAGVVTFASAPAAGVPLMYKEPHAPSSNVYRTFGTGDGTSTQFSLPWAPAVPAISVNGVLKTLTTDYTYTPDGAVTFVAAPANNAVLTWTGNFGPQR